MNKDILRISTPLFLSLVAQNVVNITDTAFLGRLGEVELGASAIGGMTYVALFMLGHGFCIGSQSLIGKHNGKGTLNEIGSVFSHGMLFLLLMGVVLILASMGILSPVFSKVMKSAEVSDAAIRFLDIRVLGIIFVYANAMFRTFYIGIMRPKVLIVNAIIMAITNVILDYCLIFGKWGLPKMGIEGAALASVIAEFLSMLFLVLWTYLKLDWRKYGLTLRRTYSLSKFKTIVGTSGYTMIQTFLGLTTWLIFFMAIEQLGQTELAVSNVLRSLYSIMMMPAQALSSAGSTLVSNAIGRGEGSKVMSILWKVMRIGLIISFFTVAATLLFPEAMMRIYTDDVALIRMGADSLWVIGVSMFFFSSGSVALYGMIGTGMTRASLVLELGALFAYMAYIVVVIMIMQSSLPVCWLSELVYWGITVAGALGCIAYFQRKGFKV